MEDPTSWICRVEQIFFQFHATPLEEQVVLASFHLEGEAQLWYQLLQQENALMTWEVFRVGLLACYGELAELQQTSLVKEYQSKFEQLLAKAGYLPFPPTPSKLL